MKVLDTAVLIDIDRGGETIREKVERLDEEGPHIISAVSVTELFLGLEKKYETGTETYREARNTLEKLIARFTLFPVDRSVSTVAARIIHSLQANGAPLHDLHDVYIAATGRVTENPVLTSNTDHFTRVEHLMVEDWQRY